MQHALVAYRVNFYYICERNIVRRIHTTTTKKKSYYTKEQTKPRLMKQKKENEYA